MQIVVCQNSTSVKREVQGILLHEMIHMFDYCRNKLNVKNIDHLACTEIRAANIGHCSFLSSVFQGNSSFVNIKATHQVKYLEREREREGIGEKENMSVCEKIY